MPLRQAHHDPVINNATGSIRTTDQRGFAITDGVLDIGAVESQGVADYPNLAPNLWNLDHDGDGHAFGMEFALGTDPFVSDAEHPNNPSMHTKTKGKTVIYFGHNPVASGYVEWVLKRSEDLVEYDTELLRYEGIAEDITGGPFEIIDDESANPDVTRYLYRFEAELLE